MNGKLGKLLFFFFTFYNFPLFSQIKIEGNIYIENSLEKVDLQGIGIQLYNENDELESYTFTDVNGNYSLITKNIGSYYLMVNDLDYESDKYSISISSSDRKINTNFIIRKKSIELKEVQIDKKNYKVKSDTIIFDAKAYAIGNEQVVEDLLKKIPGIKLDKDGAVFVNGQEIEKIMIEGDDFFEKGYKMISKNMPSKPIDKIEVLRNYSHNNLLKGLEDSDKIALNLTLEDGAKNQWFGNANLKSTFYPENYYSISANLMSFGKKNKHYFLTNFNDIGEDSTGDIDLLYKTSDNTIGDEISNPLYLRKTNNIAEIDASKYRFNQLKMGSLNSIFNLSDRLKLQSKVTAKWDQFQFYRNNNTVYYTESGDFTNTEENNSKDSTFDLKAGLDWTYVVDKNSSIVASSNFSHKYINNNEINNFNSIVSKNNIPIKVNFIDQKINYTNRINDQDVFLIDFRYLYQNNKENLFSNSQNIIFENLFGDFPVYNLYEKLHRKFNYQALEFRWIRKTSKNNLFESRFNFQRLKNQFNTTFGIQDDNQFLFPSDYQNIVHLNFWEVTANLKYIWNFTKKLSWQNYLGITYIQMNYSNINQKNPSNNVFPNFYSQIKYNPTKKHEFRVKLQYDNQSLNFVDQYDNYLYKGNRNFESKFSSNYILPTLSSSINYDYGKSYDFFNFGLESRYKFSSKYVTEKVIVSQDYKLSNAIILNDRNEILTTSYVSYLFDKVNHYLKFNFMHNYSSYKNYINSNELRDINQNFYKLGFSVNSAFKKSIVNYSLLNEWNINSFKVASSKIKQQYLTSMLDLNFKWNDNFFSKLNQNIYYLPNLQGQNTYYFSDLDFLYNYRKYKINVLLKLQNITNTNTFYNLSVNDYNKSISSYKLLPRMVFLGIDFKF